MNKHSSRSHMIFIMTVYSTDQNTYQSKSGFFNIYLILGKLFLIDLAGCEKSKLTKAEAKVLEEAKKIN